MSRYVLCATLMGLFHACDGEEEASPDFPLPSEGEGQDEGEGGGEGEGEGEGPGEGEGQNAGEGEGEDVCVQTPEVCNDLDDDCDGETDETDDLTTTGTIGKPCGTDEGECTKGIEECVDGAIVCSGEVGPTNQETCDTVDDDCDGRTDEEYDVGTPCAVGIGACRVEGLTRCSDDGMRTECDAHPGNPAQTETCINSLDDDCNGSTDDGCECDTGTSRSCGDTDEGVCELGQQSCNPDGRWGSCVGQVGPSEETCNALDDDCDGQTDNGFDVNAICVAGVGVCQRPGNKWCNQVGDATECDAVAGQPGVETCNNADDDCDGRTDDAPTDVGEVCAVGVGRCLRESVTQCQQGVEVCWAVAGQPAEEICNALDDDCDGETDDAPTDVGEVCAVGVGQCQREGVTQCQHGVEVCWAVAGQPAEEICNALDDDCDGETDEDPCPNLTGNWSWTVTFSDNRPAFSAYHALVEDQETHIITGRSIDIYGLARLNGSLSPADGSFDVTKQYSSGTSAGLSYRYTGTVQGAAGDRQLSGTWHYIANPTSNGRMTGSVQDALAFDRASGDWTIRADFGNIRTRLDTTVEGRVTGTMSDAFGNATVEGIFDRGSGFLSFRKLYDAGNAWWYSGTVTQDGQSMRNGVYRATSDGVISGRWTAVR